jgi:hypothetical protein
VSENRPLPFESSSFSFSSSDFCRRFEDDDENEEEMQALYFQTGTEGIRRLPFAAIGNSSPRGQDEGERGALFSSRGRTFKPKPCRLYPLQTSGIQILIACPHSCSRVFRLLDKA